MKRKNSKSVHVMIRLCQYGMNVTWKADPKYVGNSNDAGLMHMFPPISKVRSTKDDIEVSVFQLARQMLT